MAPSKILDNTVVSTQPCVLLHRGQDATYRRTLKVVGGLGGSFGTHRRSKLNAASSASNRENTAQCDRQCGLHCCQRFCLGKCTLEGGRVSLFQPLAVPRERIASRRKGHVSTPQMGPRLPSRLSWKKYNGCSQEGLTNGTLKEGRWDARDAIFARTDTDIDSPLYLIPMEGGLLL